MDGLGSQHTVAAFFWITDLEPLWPIYPSHTRHKLGRQLWALFPKPRWTSGVGSYPMNMTTSELLLALCRFVLAGFQPQQGAWCCKNIAIQLAGVLDNHATLQKCSRYSIVTL